MLTRNTDWIFLLGLGITAVLLPASWGHSTTFITSILLESLILSNVFLGTIWRIRNDLQSFLNWAQISSLPSLVSNSVFIFLLFFTIFDISNVIFTHSSGEFGNMAALDEKIGLRVAGWWLAAPQSFLRLAENFYSVTFVLIVSSLFAAVMTRNDRAAYRIRLSLVLSSTAALLVYKIHPTTGPWLAQSLEFSGFQTLPLQTAAFRNAMLEHENPLFGLQAMGFPTLVIAWATVACMGLFRSDRVFGFLSLPVMAGICTASVLLGWSFVTDVAGGVALGALSYLVAAILEGYAFGTVNMPSHASSNPSI